jgi:hypothetical protein
MPGWALTWTGHFDLNFWKYKQKKGFLCTLVKQISRRKEFTSVSDFNKAFFSFSKVSKDS